MFVCTQMWRNTDITVESKHRFNSGITRLFQAHTFHFHAHNARDIAVLLTGKVSVIAHDMR